MSKKYIIELEEGFTDDQGNELFRAKGFNSLVFDKNGVDKLKEYVDSELECSADEFYHYLRAPQCGSKYWAVCNPAITETVWYDDVTDKVRLKEHNVYLTEEDALIAIRHMEVSRMLQVFSTPKRELGEQYYCICCDPAQRKITVLDKSVYRYPFIFSSHVGFNSKDQAHKCIEAIGTDNLLKYYFGVPDNE